MHSDLFCFYDHDITVHFLFNNTFFFSVRNDVTYVRIVEATESLHVTAINCGASILDSSVESISGHLTLHGCGCRDFSETLLDDTPS